jgi:hypothetical protein
MSCVKCLAVERHASFKHGASVTLLCHWETPSSDFCRVLLWAGRRITQVPNS